MEQLSLKEFESRWKVLLERSARFRVDTPQQPHAEDEEDPFDCSSLVIPPIYDRINQVAAAFCQQWRELDERKIAASVYAEEQDDDDDDDPEAPAVTKKARTKKNPYWYDKHVRLPPSFDYATRQSEPPPDTGTGDRVVSLLDPTQQTSYEQELHRLFAAIPTAPQLEQEAIAGAKLIHTQALCQEITQATQEYPRLDGHALSRLRLCDRHELPPSQPSTHYTATLRLEAWRRTPKRGALPDPNRLVAEFGGKQTLYDVHQVLVELAHDDLWKDNDDGFFFINGAFYTTGSVDYTSTIQTWLRSGSILDQQRRTAYLGLSEDVTLPLPVHSMNICLDELSVQLGVRYYHVCHGDVECAIFWTDRRLTNTLHRFPILHDIWTPTFHAPTCDACQHRAAVVATSTTTPRIGHKALCQACVRQLRLDDNTLQDYSVWRSQGNLSSGATRESAF